MTPIPDPPPAPRAWADRRVGWVAVPVMLAAIVLVQTNAIQQATCETFDEFTFLRLGIDVYRKGDLHGFASPMDPALPVWLEYTWAALSAHALPDTPGWEREVPFLVRRARVQTSLVVGVPLVWFVYGWLARRRGWRAGALGGLLIALSPTIVAAMAVATTDACAGLFALVALATLVTYQTHPSRWSLILLGVGLGLGLAAKQSAVFLVLVTAIELLIAAWPRRGAGQRWEQALVLTRSVGGRLLIVALIGFLTDWATFGFGLGPRFRTRQGHVDLPILVPMLTGLLPAAVGDSLLAWTREWGAPLPIETFLGLVHKARLGHSSYLMGAFANRGFWLFFPVAIAVKSTPVELVLLAIAFRRGVQRATWSDPARRIWMTSFLSVLVMALTSTLNYGHRHVLLIYLLAVLLVIDGMNRPRSRFQSRARGTAALLIVIGQAWSAVAIAPNDLGYFNVLCGGPNAGYRYLVDSSLDWGQDLPALRRALEARRYRRVALGYFGTASPTVQGLRSHDWRLVDEATAAECDWLAFSATTLVGAYSHSTVLRDHFEHLPAIRVTPSWFLYDLSDPRVRRAWAAARGAGAG